MLGDKPEQIEVEMMATMKAEGFSSPVEVLSTSSNISDMTSGTGGKENSVKSLKELKRDEADFIEKKAIKYTLDMNGWNKSKTARQLGISYKTLFYKMNNLGIEK